MDFVYVLPFLVSVFLLSLIAIGGLTRFYVKYRGAFCPIKEVSATVLILGIFIPTFYYAIYQDIIWRVGLFFLLVLAFVYIQIRASGWGARFFSFILCLGATLMLPADQPLFQDMPMYIVYPLLSISMFLLIRLINYLDQTEWMSVLGILSQGVLFILMTLVGILPVELGLLFLIVMAVSVAVVFSMRFWGEQAILGRYGVSVISFSLATLWAYIASFNFGLIPVIAFAADIFQVILVFVATTFSLKCLTPLRGAILFELALNRGIKTKQLLYYMFFIQTLLSLLVFAGISKSFKGGFSIWMIVAVILVDMVIRLRKWGEPSPSFKDVASDLKTGVGVLFKEMQHIPLKSDKEEKSLSEKKNRKKRKK